MPRAKPRPPVSPKPTEVPTRAVEEPALTPVGASPAAGPAEDLLAAAAEGAVALVVPSGGPAAGVVGELTSEQARIQELERELLALRADRADRAAEPVPPRSTPVALNPGDKILIHFLEDGLTALSTVWMRGQELEVEVGSATYAETCDKFGQSWLDMRDDDFAQVERWGVVRFRSGPWPGKSWDSILDAQYQAVKDLKTGQLVPPPTEEELARAIALEKRRQRGAPKVPVSA